MAPIKKDFAENVDLEILISDFQINHRSYHQLTYFMGKKLRLETIAAWVNFLYFL
jgi:hypothetical protein